MKFWLSVDVGCLECGEESAFVLFDNEADAKAHNEAAADKQADEWHGQHSFSVVALEVHTSGETKG